MAFTFSELIAIFPEQIWIEVSKQTQEEIWRVAQQRYSNAGDRWTAYLNLLCLDRFLAWFQAEFDQQVQLQPEADRSSVVAGTRLTVGDAHMVLIPDDKSTVSEFCIPQAWMDIPAWVADYYLAVQLNLEAGWLRVWGYATNAQIREQASYETIDRTYCLAAEDLIRLDVLWVTQAMTQQKPAEALPSQVALFKQLTQSPTDSPAPEEAALLVSDEP